MSKQTKSKKRTLYHYEKFPFDKMSIATEGDGFYRNTEFKRVRMNTRIDGNDYAITFDQDFKAGPILYVIYDGKPSLSVRFTLNPQWETKDANGNISRKESPTGNKVKAFWVKYRIRIIELLNALPEKKLVELIGAKRAANFEDTLEEIFSFPDVEGLTDVPDKDKSEQFKCKLFTGDYKKMKNPSPRDELLIIPGTDVVIYTTLRKCYGDGSPDEGKKIMQYEKARDLIYCKTPHENAVNRYFALMAEPIINAPSVTYGKDGNGFIQLPLNTFNVSNKKIYGGDGSLTNAEKENIRKRRLTQLEELGFSADDYAQNVKKPKIEDNSSTFVPHNNEIIMGNDLSDGDDNNDSYDDLSC